MDIHNVRSDSHRFQLLLHLNNGLVNGKQVVPNEVIQLAIQVQNPNYIDKDSPQNGLFWYVKATLSLRSEMGEEIQNNLEFVK